MKKLAVLLLAAPLSACIFMKEIPLPDGSKGYAISNCRDAAACYRKAAETCGGKYEIIESSTQTVGVGVISSPHQMTFSCPD